MRKTTEIEIDKNHKNRNIEKEEDEKHNTGTNRGPQKKDEKKEEEATKNLSESLETAVSIFQERDVKRVRRACKILKGATDAHFERTCKYIQAWIASGLSWEVFPGVVRPVFNLMVTSGRLSRIQL